MKKTIFSLMLSASILSVSSLFAMEDPNEPSEPPHKTGIKRTASSIDDGENLEPQPKLNVDKLVEGAMTLLEKIKGDKNTTDTKKRHIRHDSFIVGTRVSF